MNASRSVLFTVCLLLFYPMLSNAQCTTAESSCGHPVPHLIRFQQVLRDGKGAAYTGVIAVRFSIYAVSEGGTPLWQETQNVELDQQGHFEIMLGANTIEGVPSTLFPPGEPRWIGLQPVLPGEGERPRALMVSVPYALQAANAETLGGLPASAFARAGSSGLITSSGSVPLEVTPGPTSPASAGVAGSSPNWISGSGTNNTIPKFSTAGTIVNSQIEDAGGVVSMQNLSGILFADRFPGGVPDAVAACPSNGCVIYATSPKVNLNLGNIDPGFKAITIYLGPYTYTVKQVMLRKGLKIIGMGGSANPSGTIACSVSAPCNGTALQSINGNNPVFIIPQVNNAPASNVVLSGFRLWGSVGNTSEDGFFIDTSSTVNSGFTNSLLHDVVVERFAGMGIHFKGRANDFAAASQWLLFDNVVALRPPGGGNALTLEGAVFELRFRNCQFDGPGIGDGTNIYIGGRPGGAGGNAFPTSIVFEGLVSQQAALAVRIDGGLDLTFYGSHHELLSAAYQVTADTGMYTLGLTISDSYFAGNVGVNGGAGYDLNITTTLAQGIYFVHNRVTGKPDAVVKSMNLASVVYQDNLFCDTCLLPETSGITTQIAPATSINTRGVHSVGLNPSTTPITTIQSSLGPGETVTFFTFAGPVTFASGGNIDLMGQSSVVVNGTITFMRTDLGGLYWIPVAQWSPPSTTSTGI